MEELRENLPIVRTTGIMEIIFASRLCLHKLPIIQTYTVRLIDCVAQYSLRKGAPLNGL